MAEIGVARVYDEPGSGDGLRILVDRLWPRGLSKQHARLDDWAKEVAPSTELRRWFGHDPDRVEEFAERYRDELEDEAHRQGLDELRATVGSHRATLLTATKDLSLSHAPLLAEYLRTAEGQGR